MVLHLLLEFVILPKLDLICVQPMHLCKVPAKVAFAYLTLAMWACAAYALSNQVRLPLTKISLSSDCVDPVPIFHMP